MSVMTIKRTTKNARKGSGPAGETYDETRARCKGGKRASPRAPAAKRRPDCLDADEIQKMHHALRKNARLSRRNRLHQAVWRLLLGD